MAHASAVAMRLVFVGGPLNSGLRNLKQNLVLKSGVITAVTTKFILDIDVALNTVKNACAIKSDVVFLDFHTFNCALFKALSVNLNFGI